MSITNNIDNDIKFLAKSEIRLKILGELDKKPDNVQGIAKKTSIAYSSVSNNIGKLLGITSTYHLPITPMLLLDIIIVKSRCYI